MMTRAVFLDRDGTINVDVGYAYRSDQVIWIEGAIEAIRLLNDLDYLVFIVTNQSGIARGYYTEEDVVSLHKWMADRISFEGGAVAGFYFCPHLRGSSVKKYSIDCSCRKPEPGLIIRAIESYALDKTASFLIGDQGSDVMAACRAGIEGYLFDGSNLRVFLDKVLAERRQI